MQAAVKSNVVTVADYLAAEEVIAIQSLEDCVLVAQAEREVTVFRRTNDGRELRRISGVRGRVALPSLEVTPPLSAICEGH